MSYYRTCPDCGAALDPGERCDCGKKENAELRRRCHDLLDELNGPNLEARAYRFIQYLYIHGDKKAAANAANIDDGKADQKANETN